MLRSHEIYMGNLPNVSKARQSPFHNYKKRLVYEQQAENFLNSQSRKCCVKTK